MSEPARPGGAVATPHASATEAGYAVLADGGNAVDAALAAAAVLSVVYPNQCTVGGDAIALVGGPSVPPMVVNGSGRSAQALRPSDVLDADGYAPTVGAGSVTVPGALDLWEQLAQRWGSWPLAAALLPAAELAAAGFPVAAGVARDLVSEHDLLARDAGARDVFLAGGEPPRAGELLRLPRLADTLRTLAADGTAAFYRGPVGASVVATLREQGSALTVADLADHHAEVAAPLSTEFAGEDYLSAGGNSQGRFFLRALGALDLVRRRTGTVPDALGTGAAVVAHILARCADERDRLLGDPAGGLDLDHLLSDASLAELADAGLADAGLADAGLSSDVRHRETRRPGDTVAVVTADAGGMWVSLLQSAFHAFGSGVVDPGTGILMHNRGASFSGVPGSPGELAPGRRPPHTLMPVLVRRDDRLVGAHGTMGGRGQPQIHVHLALALAAGLSPAAAVSRPRWVVGRLEAGAAAAEDAVAVAAERDTPAAALEQLRAAGFRTHPLPALADAVGHAQVIRRAGRGWSVGTDPRADAAPAPGGAAGPGTMVP